MRFYGQALCAIAGNDGFQLYEIFKSPWIQAYVPSGARIRSVNFSSGAQQIALACTTSDQQGGTDTLLFRYDAEQDRSSAIRIPRFDAASLAWRSFTDRLLALDEVGKNVAISESAARDDLKIIKLPRQVKKIAPRHSGDQLIGAAEFDNALDRDGKVAGIGLLTLSELASISLLWENTAAELTGRGGEIMDLNSDQASVVGCAPCTQHVGVVGLKNRAQLGPINPRQKKKGVYP